MRTYTLNLSTNSTTNPPVTTNGLNTQASWNVNWREIFGNKTGECRVRALLQTVYIPQPPTAIFITNYASTSSSATSITVMWSGGLTQDINPVTMTFKLNGTLTTPNSVGSGTATFTGLTPNTTYTIIIIATTIGGTQSKTTIVTTNATVITAINNFMATNTTTTATVSYTGGIGIPITYTYLIQNLAGATLTGYTLTGSGTGTVISGLLLSQSPWFIQLTVSNSLGNQSVSVTAGQFKLYYSFENGTTSGLINDTTGYFGGTVTGTASLSSSVVRYGSYSAYCDGVSYVNMVTSADMYSLFNDATGISVAFWIYPTTLGNNQFFNYIFGISNAGGYITLHSGGRTCVSTTSMPLNTWSHICVTCPNGGGQTIYFNNSPISTGASIQWFWLLLASGNFRFGGNGNVAYYDNCYCYNRVLTSGEVNSLYYGSDVAY